MDDKIETLEKCCKRARRRITGKQLVIAPIHQSTEERGQSM